MRDIGVCNKLADFRQYRSDLFGAFGHHAHDGPGGYADTEHAAQKVMDAIDAYGPVGTEKSGQNGKGIAILDVSPDVIRETAFHFQITVIMRA